MMDKSFIDFTYIRGNLFQNDFDELKAFDKILEEIVRFILIVLGRSAGTSFFSQSERVVWKKGNLKILLRKFIGTKRTLKKFSNFSVWISGLDW